MIRTKKQLWIVSTVAIAGSLLYFYFDPSFNRFFPPCPFNWLTGLYCPGCGSQRAFHDTLHGHLSSAAGHNILFVIFLPLLFFAAVVALHNLFSKKKWGQRLFYSASFARIILTVTLLFWILRNIPAAPFNLLAP
ncbi:MAG: DUF2752 domain-containing protein [Flavitalea sp.]